VKKKPFTEQGLLEGLNTESDHVEELVQPLMQEPLPQERLQGSEKLYERLPTDLVWDEYFDSDERVSDDYMADRDQPSRQSRK
tara:strand:- start:240 stop:488 length:249 start_codon:yes stop_codon:yes gene_type:complete